MSRHHTGWCRTSTGGVLGATGADDCAPRCAVADLPDSHAAAVAAGHPSTLDPLADPVALGEVLREFARQLGDLRSRVSAVESALAARNAATDDLGADLAAWREDVATRLGEVGKRLDTIGGRR